MAGFFSKRSIPWEPFKTGISIDVHVYSTDGTATISDPKELQALLQMVNSAAPVSYAPAASYGADNYHISIHTGSHNISLSPASKHGTVYADVSRWIEETKNWDNQRVLIRSEALSSCVHRYRNIKLLQEQEQQYKARIHDIVKQGEDIRRVNFCVIHDDDLPASIYTHCVDEQTFHFFNRIDRGQVGAFKGHTLLSVSDILEDDDNLDAKWFPNQRVEDITFPENRIFFLRKSEHGRHRIGGPLPAGFTRPAHPELKTPFQYLGTLDGTDPKFSWLGVDKLHLAFPVKECLKRVFLDYTNPDAPAVVSLANHSDAWFKTSGRVRDIEYQQVNYEVYEDIDAVNFEDLDEMNVCGVPFWYNDPDLHRCPRTGRFMRFVCSIQSDRENKVLNPEEAFPDARYPDPFLSFVEPMHLFVFMCPESRILYITR